ncbi:MAG: single-stranded DNA-binding protein [Oligoflexales bacterium]
MASVNKAIILGRLGRDPELKYTQNQTAVTTLNIATSEFRNTPEGQRQEMTEWHRVTVWNKVAENCCRYLKKGSEVYVEGRIQTRSWEKEGQKQYTTEIVGNVVQFLGGRDMSRGDDQGMDAGRAAPSGYAAPQQSYQAPAPAQDYSAVEFPRPAATNQYAPQQPVQDAGGISLDDIPF